MAAYRDSQIPYLDTDDLDWRVEDSRRGVYYAAFDGPTLVGVSKLYHWPEQAAHLNQWRQRNGLDPIQGKMYSFAYVAVHPSHRRRGVGMKLQNAVLQDLSPGDVLSMSYHEPEGKKLTRAWLSSSSAQPLLGERYTAFERYDPTKKNVWVKDIRLASFQRRLRSFSIQST